MIKPDAVQRGLIGQIISRFEAKGLTLRSLKFLSVPRRVAEELYNIHKGKPFYEKLVSYITSGPVVAMIWEGPNVISVVRLMVGNTKSNEALPGTIRGDYGLTIDNNIIHASDSPGTFTHESSQFFDQIVEWTPISRPWT